MHLLAQVHAESTGSKKPLTECDPIQLAIFSHRSAPGLLSMRAVHAQCCEVRLH